MTITSWDLWIDFQRADDRGNTRGSTQNLREGLVVRVGDLVVVGNEDAEPGVAVVVELGERGFIVVNVFPGTVEENRFRLSNGLSSAT